MTARLHILVQTPAHSQIARPLSYLSEQPLEAGTLVRVPFGKRETLGVVWGDASAGDATPNATLTDDQLRPIGGVLDGIAPLCANWRQLVTFAARYYQRSLGEVALAALPPQLRDLDTTQLAKRLTSQARKVAKAQAAEASSAGSTSHTSTTLPALTDQQTDALAQFNAHPGPFLLFGATGSGKTEVYLRCVAQLLAAEPMAQALVMVPEINLTPQLEARFRTRFEPLVGHHAVVALHSGMTPPQRLKAWLAAHAGTARIVLGTRLAVFASLPHLKLIVVDEEHDPSYKQTEGARYSARDLAVWRGRQDGAKVLLGSATPSLESWHQSRPASEGGRYLRLDMPGRVGQTLATPPTVADAESSGGALLTARVAAPPVATGTATASASASASDTAAETTQASFGAANASGAFARVVRVDMNHQPKKTVISAPLLRAIQERVARGEQSLLFLNRRGYAPVLACTACDWKSECPYCSAYRVFHKLDRTIRCHHCGFTEPVPRACPECGNVDLQTVGRGTERLEEHIAELLASELQDGTESTGAQAPGEAVHSPRQQRILRIDADSTRLKGELEKQLARVHDGDVDVLVGTQMIAKGHDFRRITLVAAVNPDGALFSSDFRAPERLFALLMQAAGRAGRDSRISTQSEMWLQTFYPQHPLFDALKRHDYPAFARQQLQERQAALLPPFSFQALVRADARTQEVAQGFLRAAAEAAQQPGVLPDAAYVTIYPAVPMGIQRVANVERAQMLVESVSRGDLQRFLAAWHGVLHTTRQGPQGKGLIRWAVDVDPLLI